MKSAAGTPGSAPFIITTSLAKPDPKTRRLIRSHVMRGKNEGKFRSSKYGPRPQWVTSPREDVASKKATGTQERVPDQPTRQPRQDGWVLISPRKIATELSLYGFGGDMQPYVQELIHRAFTIVKPSMYAWPGMAPADPQENLFCFDNLAQHPGVLHSTLFVAQAFHDSAVGSSDGTVAQLHLSKALSHLQQSLNNRKEAVQLSTMAVITSLAMAAVLAGDLDTAAKHMDGLYRIVSLRGGLHSLEPGSMIEHKARSIDLGLAMARGTPLRFLRDDHLSWSPNLPPPLSSSPQTRSSLSPFFAELDSIFQSQPPCRPDPRLLNVWADLGEFSRLVNDNMTATVSSSKLTALAISVPHRLLRLKPLLVLVGSGPEEEHSSSLHELLRLGMLAYAKMLLVRLSGVGRKMVVLAGGLKAVLTGWDYSLGLGLYAVDDVGMVNGCEETVKLLLWALFVASMSIFEELDQIWLREMLVRTVSVLGLQTWAEARAALKGFLWIDVVFDQPGQRVFEWCYEVQVNG